MMEDGNAFELRAISATGSVVSDEEEEDSYEEERVDGRRRRASVQSYELYTPDEDREVLKKLDRRLVGFMALLYCLSFLDRSSEFFSCFFRFVGWIGWGDWFCGMYRC